MEVLKHHGETLSPRIISVPTRSRGRLTTLTPGRNVLEELTELLREMGTDSGYVELFSGSYTPVSYCVPAGADSERAVSFSEARSVEHAELVYGAVTVGLRDNEPFIHSHCMWIDENQQQLGGHLWPETASGSPAPHAAIYGIYGARWTSADDPETRMPVFTPSIDERNPMPNQLAETGYLETVVARVRPNEDLTTAIVFLCEENGFTSAVVRGGLGSLVGATFFDRSTGGVTHVDGPGTEVISIMGDVALVNGVYETTISCTLVDLHGVVHAGELVPGENAVAVTFELVIQKIS
ncbi:PPC domain-containing DNA-binding protein [Salinibacterium sp. NK8237]|uniref:PPC domain-containing DNA-binding protein n=1 Tax=Salinibacterium sp. NK8237 TaxID=2792038 RepID=UPI0018CF1684|nr:PPC domain-containing DNA-binding protein [Salinibacterium sp. NK8237]MBH0130926.1 DNA-binding protein [Salinibacterium sp. NK8237]